MAPDLDGKRLELLKEAFPKVARVAFLWEPVGARGNLALTEMEAAAKALGLKLQSLEVRGLDDFEGAFARAKRDGAQALITTPSALINTQQRQVLDFAAKNRLPAMYPYSEFVEAGGLMSYAPNNTDLFRRAADFVDKILKGTKPADLPVEQPTKFEFIVNLKAAKQIGVTIPPNVLARADRVIKIILDFRLFVFWKALGDSEEHDKDLECNGGFVSDNLKSKIKNRKWAGACHPRDRIRDRAGRWRRRSSRREFPG